MTTIKRKYLRVPEGNRERQRVVLLVDIPMPHYITSKVAGDIVDAEWIEPAEGSGGFMGWSVFIPYREGSAGSGKLCERMVSIDGDEAEPLEWAECPTTAAYFARKLRLLTA